MYAVILVGASLVFFASPAKGMLDKWVQDYQGTAPKRGVKNQNQQAESRNNVSQIGLVNGVSTEKKVKKEL